jgi:putative transposase
MEALNLRRERHSVSSLQLHLVCVVKYRRSVFTDEGLRNIEATFKSVAEKMGFDIREFNGEANHIHALIEYPPKLAVSKIVNHLKGASSRIYRSSGFKCPSESALWSPSYFVMSVGGAPIEVLRQYIESQARPEAH